MKARERIEELKAQMIAANKSESVVNEDGSLWFCITVRSQLEVFDWCLAILAEDEAKTCGACGLFEADGGNYPIGFCDRRETTCGGSVWRDAYGCSDWTAKDETQEALSELRQTLMDAGDEIQFGPNGEQITLAESVDGIVGRLENVQEEAKPDGGDTEL